MPFFESIKTLKLGNVTNSHTQKQNRNHKCVKFRFNISTRLSENYEIISLSQKRHEEPKGQKAIKVKKLFFGLNMTTLQLNQQLRLERS